MRHLLPLIVTFALTLPAFAEPVQSDVFVSGQDGYHTYRIPALAVTAKGTVLAFCEGRKKGGGDAGDINLVLKRSTDGGKTFSPAITVWDDADNTCGNPCPIVDRATGTVFLLMTHNLGADHERQIIDGVSKGTRTVWMSESSDDGLTWSKPRDITPETKKKDWTWYATGPGAGIQLKSGRLIAPCDHMTADKKYNSHVIYSDDAGKSWKLGGAITPSVNECKIVELSDGKLMMNMRNYNRKFKARATATSTDGGLTWSAVSHDEALIEPICQASLMRLPDEGGKARFVFSNPASTKRENMTTRISEDDCKSWPRSLVLHKGPAAYSDLAVLPDGTVLCLYERGEKSPYQLITLAKFAIADLK